MDTIHTLENRNLKHSRQYIENAKIYLENSINSFQYITYSVPDRKLLDGIKYNDYTSTKRSKKLHKIIDDLYKNEEKYSHGNPLRRRSSHSAIKQTRAKRKTGL